MRDTLKIGEFSVLGRVSVRMLRHYEKRGLLVPAETDSFTSYRYYTLDQLPRLNRIIALKELGFSLEQVGGILANDPPVAEMRSLRNERRELLAGLFIPQAKACVEMMYEFTKPFVVDSGSIERELGLRTTPIETGLAKTVNWYRERAGR